MSRSSSVTTRPAPRVPRPPSCEVGNRRARDRRGGAAVLLFAFAGSTAVSACLRFDPFGCQEDTQCDAEAMGRCDTTGWCSYPDLDCATGYRFEANAGDGLGGECVGTDPTGTGTALTTSSATEPDLDTGPDSTGSTGSTSDDGPTSEDTATGDTCGGGGEACCMGDACDPGLQCAGGRCGCVQAVAVGDRHTCVIKLDGSVSCWGANDLGQLATDPVATPMSPVPLDVAGLAAVEGLSAHRHTCALANDAVSCWGDNAGQKANPADVAPVVLMPAPVTLPAPVAQLGVGGSHTCAGLGAGQAPYCWGDNSSGQLTGTDPVIGIVTGGFDPFYIALGTTHSCMSTLSGELYCWGANTFGQLGVDPALTPTSTTPIALGSLTVGMTVAGAEHTCVTAGVDVICWGRNNLGQLGIGSNVDTFTPSLVTFPPGAGNVSSLVAAADQTCALMFDGSVLCWGGNQAGELLLAPDETGEDGFALAPRPIELGFAVMQLATGVTHSCALGTDGQVRCWGDNGQGQIGDGTTTNALEPTHAQISCP